MKHSTDYQAAIELLADASHEVRTPLNGIIGFTDMLQDTVLTPQQSEYVQTIHKEAQHMLAIINRMLDFTKSEVVQPKVVHEPVMIRQCVYDVMTLLEPAAQAKGVALRCFISDTVPERVLSDGVRLKQIFTNLLANAVKFTQQGQITVRVDCTSETATEVILAGCVEDTGVGLSQHETAQLFEAFRQVGSAAEQRQGSGLGLHIVRRLVHYFDGDIHCESCPGKGSVFRFTVRCKKATTAVLPASSEHTSSLTQYSACVMVVDDHAINLRVAEQLLINMGMTVLCAQNSASAIALAKKQPALDLIFMDIHMPGWGGVETVQHIKALSAAHQNIPCIALTAYAAAHEQQACLQAGMADCLLKPLQQAAVQACLARWLGNGADAEIAKSPGNPLTEDAASDSATVNWPLSVRLADHRPDLAYDLLQLLLDAIPPARKAIDDALLANNLTELGDSVHHLHGACCYCGVPRLKRYVEQLERCIRQEAHQKIGDATIKAIAAVSDESRRVQSAILSMPERPVHNTVMPQIG